MIFIPLIGLLLIGIYYFWNAKQTKQQLANHGGLSVSYLFQEHPGQYSGDRSVKSGVIVIHTSSHNQKLKHATLKRVSVKHPDLHIQLDQSLALPFHYELLPKPEVSIRYKVINKELLSLDLTGVMTTIAGKLHFEGGKTRPFQVMVPISGFYQQQSVH